MNVLEKRFPGGKAVKVTEMKVVGENVFRVENAVKAAEILKVVRRKRLRSYYSRIWQRVLIATLITMMMNRTIMTKENKHASYGSSWSETMTSLDQQMKSDQNLLLKLFILI